MQPNRENFKARALELIGHPQARLSTREKIELYAYAYGDQPFTAALAATVNKISERLRVTA